MIDQEYGGGPIGRTETTRVELIRILQEVSRSARVHNARHVSLLFGRVLWHRISHVPPLLYDSCLNYH